MWGHITSSLVLVVSPVNLAMVLIGTVLGMIFGALPGFSAVMAVAVLIPLTFGMSPTVGLILLGAIYCGAIYGGSISAILLRTPGTDANAMTALDGYEMTKKGQGGQALTESAVASFWGGILSVFALLFMAPQLAKIALKFGPQENFMLAVFGLSIIAMISSRSLIKGIIGGLFGMLIGTIGMDPLLGQERYTFGFVGLMSGVALVPALIGLFSFSQVLELICNPEDSIVHIDARKIQQTAKVSFKDLFCYPKVYLRSSIIGILVGILPGAGTNIAAFLGYTEGQRASKHPELFGHGSREAVASAEAANNAVTGGSLIPLLTLGIPGNSVTAVMLGGLMIQGLIPGPQLFDLHADITYTFILSLFLANVAFLVIGLFGAPYFAKVVNTPINILVACILVLTVMGSYSMQRNMMDVYIMILFGLIGFVIKKYDFQSPPIVLGIILGPIADKGLNQSITLALKKSVWVSIFTRPICIVLLICTIVTILTPLMARYRKKNKKNQTLSIRDE